MEEKIKGYLKFKRIPIDLFGKQGVVPIEDRAYNNLFGTLSTDSKGDMTISLGRKEGEIEFVFIIPKNDDTDKKEVFFNYIDGRKKFNSMVFEDNKGQKSIESSGVFSSNEYEEIMFCEYVETLNIDNNISSYGGKLKIKARLTADVPLRCLLSLESGIVTQCDA